MKKVLMILALMLLMLSLGGCGSDGGDGYSYEEISAITKEKVLSVAGKWSVSQGLSATDGLTLTELEQDEEDGSWAIGYIGNNYIDVCSWNIDEECYIAGTIYDSGEIELYSFNFVGTDNISGVYTYSTDGGDTFFESVAFTRYRTSTSNLASVKAINVDELKNARKVSIVSANEKDKKAIMKLQNFVKKFKK